MARNLQVTSFTGRGASALIRSMGMAADDRRRWYGWLLTGSGLYLALSGLFAATAAPMLVAAGLVAGGAGVCLLRRVRWGRALACGLVLSVVLERLVSTLLSGEPIPWWRVALAAAAAWGVLDMATMPVTADEEDDAVREARRARAREVHIRDQLEAALLERLALLEAGSRQAHEARDHAGAWEGCAEAACAEARALVEKHRREVG
jgi:hypothetical protein